MTERWLPVVGYEGRYEVSDLGRVCSLVQREPRILKDHGGPYRRVSLYLIDAERRLDGRRKPQQRGVHALVLEAFVGLCPPGLECRHLNGDPFDCRLGNLAWGTSLENSQDTATHGHRLRGKDQNGSKLTEEQVREIRALRSAGHSLQAIAG